MKELELDNNKFYRNQSWLQINKRFDIIEKEIRDIKENHLAEIYEEISSIKQKLAYYTGGLAVLIVIVQIIIKIIR